MAILHVLSNPQAAESCLSTAGNGDAVLLVGDGTFVHHIAQPPGIRFGVLEEDMAGRGLEPSSAVEALTYADFVEWVATYSKSVTWR